MFKKKERKEKMQWWQTLFQGFSLSCDQIKVKVLRVNKNKTVTCPTSLESESFCKTHKKIE